MQTIYWPCLVTRERSGYYLVTPISAYPCASSGASLDDATAAAKQALQEYVASCADAGLPILPPTAGFSLDDLQAKRIIRIEVSATA